MRHPHQDLQGLQANARKSFSQNFLVSPHWRVKLTDAVLNLADYDELWEVGPGLGSLTEILAEKSKRPIRLFEYDRKLAENLRAKFPELTMVEGDFLRVNLPLQLETKKIAFLSNTPYHLSSAILFLLVEHRHQFSGIVMTFQKEFADRMTAQPRTKDYGALTVLMQLTFDMESLGIIPKGAFYPAPSIDSRAVVLTAKKLGVDFQSLSKVTHQAFLHRRKKVSSNLKQHYPAERVTQALSELGFSDNARSEEISPELFAILTSKLTSDTREGH